MEVANKPFKKVWLDIFYFEKHSFLLIKDDCTNFVIARNIPDKFSQTILKTLTDIFNLFGIHKRLGKNKISPTTPEREKKQLEGFYRTSIENL